MPCKIILKTLTAKQKEAVNLCLSSYITIINGGPGTGKTTTIKSIVYELERRSMKYILGAFTGKAVTRLKEIVERAEETMTLDLMIASNNSIIDPTKIDYLIIDEVSMLTGELLYRTLRRIHRYEINKNLHIIFVGDLDQLQAIGNGDLFRQLILSEIAIITLDIDMRRANKGQLFWNLQHISRYNEVYKDGILGKDHFAWDQDCLFYYGDKTTVEKLVSETHIPELLNEGYAIEKISNMITVLTPFNKDIDELNSVLRKHFNPNYYTTQPVFDKFNKLWYIGDRVMMTENCKDIGIMNGHEGVIKEINNLYIKGLIFFILIIVKINYL